MPKASKNSTVDFARDEFDKECISGIYRMIENGKRVTQDSLEEFIEETSFSKDLLASQSLVATIRRFKKDSLIDISARNVTLTRKGSSQAETIVRSQRLAECAAASIFNVDIQHVSEQAQALCKAITPHLESKILDILDNPAVSPFGYPIPGSGRVGQKSDLVKLTDAQEGKDMVVSRIPMESRELLTYLLEKGIVPGQAVVVEHVAHITGVISFLCGGQRCVIANNVVGGIWLQEPSGDVSDEDISSLSEEDVHVGPSAPDNNRVSSQQPAEFHSEREPEAVTHSP